MAAEDPEANLRGVTDDQEGSAGKGEEVSPAQEQALGIFSHPAVREVLGFFIPESEFKEMAMDAARAYAAASAADAAGGKATGSGKPMVADILRNQAVEDVLSRYTGKDRDTIRAIVLEAVKKIFRAEQEKASLGQAQALRSGLQPQGKIPAPPPQPLPEVSGLQEKPAPRRSNPLAEMRGGFTRDILPQGESELRLVDIFGRVEGRPLGEQISIKPLDLNRRREIGTAARQPVFTDIEADREGRPLRFRINPDLLMSIPKKIQDNGRYIDVLARTSRVLPGREVAPGCHLLAFCAVALTPQEQAQLYRTMAGMIINIHQEDRSLLDTWYQSQKRIGGRNQASPFDVLREQDLEPGTGKLKPAGERVLEYKSLSAGVAWKDTFVRAWQNWRIPNLKSALDEDRLTPRDVRRIEVLAFSVAYGKMVELEKR